MAADPIVADRSREEVAAISVASVATAATLAALALGGLLAARGASAAVLWDAEVPLSCVVLAAVGALTTLDPDGVLRRASALWLGWVVVCAATLLLGGVAGIERSADLLAVVLLVQPLVPSARFLGPTAGWLVACAVWLPLVVAGAHHLVARGAAALDASEQERRWAALGCSSFLLLAALVVPPLAPVALGRVLADPAPTPVARELAPVARWWPAVAAVAVALVLAGSWGQVEPLVRMSEDRTQLAGALLLIVALVAGGRGRAPRPQVVPWLQRCTSLAPGAIIGVGPAAVISARAVTSSAAAAVLVGAVVVVAGGALLSPVVRRRVAVLRPALQPGERRWVLPAVGLAGVLAAVLVAAAPAGVPPPAPTDDFERADGVDAFGGGPLAWRQESGRWGIDGGAAVPVESFLGRPYALVDAGTSDLVVRAQLDHVVPGMGIATRAVDPSTMWLAVTDAAGLWRVSAIDAGSESIVAEVAAPSADGTVVELRATGDVLTLHVDGRAVVRIVDDRLRGATIGGIASASENLGSVRVGWAAVGPLASG